MITISEIHAFCKIKGISYTRFGKLAADYPNFVFKFAEGRSIKKETQQQVRKWMDDNAKNDLRNNKSNDYSMIDASYLVYINGMENFSKSLLQALWKSHRKILQYYAENGKNVVFIKEA